MQMRLPNDTEEDECREDRDTTGAVEHKLDTSLLVSAAVCFGMVAGIVLVTRGIVS